MKKFLIIIIILLSATFIYLKTQTLGSQTSSFNQTTRYTLGRYQILRTIFGLHNYSDARAWFLEGNSPFTVELVQAKGFSITNEALNSFAAEVEKYTGRKVQLISNDQIQNGILTEQDIADIANKYRKSDILAQPNLFVIYADDFQRTDEEVGKTFQEYGIVMSHNRLVEVTKDYPSSLSQYEESTLLHEFGHQIGLEHNTGLGCLMNEAVEHPSNAGSFNGQYTQTDFCQIEIDTINSIKANLK